MFIDPRGGTGRSLQSGSFDATALPAVLANGIYVCGAEAELNAAEVFAARVKTVAFATAPPFAPAARRVKGIVNAQSRNINIVLKHSR